MENISNPLSTVKIFIQLYFLGNKLNAKIITTATALTFFHRYNAASPDPSYDPYVRFF